MTKAVRAYRIALIEATASIEKKRTVPAPRRAPVRSLIRLLLSLNPHDWVSQSKAEGRMRARQRRTWIGAERPLSVGPWSLWRRLRDMIPETYPEHLEQSLSSHPMSLTVNQCLWAASLQSSTRPHSSISFSPQ